MKRWMLIACLALPAATPAAEFQRGSLDGGRPLWVAEDPRLPRQTVILRFEVGTDTLPPPQQALAGVLLEWIKAANIRDSDSLVALNCARSLEVDGRCLSIQVAAAPADLKAALALTAAWLARADYPAAEFLRDRQQSIWSAQGQVQELQSGFAVFSQWDAYHGNQSLGGIYPGPKARLALSAEDARAALGTLLDPAHLALASGGPMPVTALASAIRQGMPELLAGAYQAPTWSEPDADAFCPPKLRVKLWPRPKQGEVLLRLVVPRTLGTAPRALALAQVVAERLGGGWRGGLWQALRERQGWTYGVFLESSTYAWTLRLQCDKGNLAPVLAALPGLFDAGRKEAPSVEDLADVVKHLKARELRRTASPGEAMTQALGNLVWQGDPDYGAKYLAALDALTPEAVKTGAQALTLDKGLLYLAGDEDSIRAALAKNPWTGKDIGILDSQAW